MLIQIDATTEAGRSSKVWPESDSGGGKFPRRFRLVQFGLQEAPKPAIKTFLVFSEAGKGNAVLSKTETWDDYLRNISQPGGYIRPEVAKEARWVHNAMAGRANLPEPQAGPTEHNSLLMVFDQSEHHLEVEVSPTLGFEWFYRNRDTDEYCGQEGLSTRGWSTEFIRVLRLFA